jgi:outer membrane protein assembly factor BamB
VADGQDLPDTWNPKSGKHIRWKTLIPGLAHSSPVIWGGQIFMTTAVSSEQDASFRHGLYGDGNASDDRSVHEWKLFCLNKHTGEVIWDRLVTKGVPVDKRHIKATYANSTPATNGKAVIALFGSEGLFAYDVNGQFLWKRDLGRINCGAYDAPNYEWGSSSSPIIFKNSVIVQVDTQDDDYLLALNIKTGETLWKTERDELPSWGTPTIVQTKKGIELVTNSSNFIYGYDPLTGKELWRLGGSSKITAPTPVYQDSLIIVCSGRGPEAPIFAIRTGARGTITLKESETSNQYIAWSKTRRGPYMPTPVIYRGLLYTVNNNGKFWCYDFKTGAEIYEEKLPHRGGGFSASPVAADGKLYLASEDGDIFVMKAGPDYKLIAANDMDELLMATPALSEGLMIVRAQYHVFAIGR